MHLIQLLAHPISAHPTPAFRFHLDRRPQGRHQLLLCLFSTLCWLNLVHLHLRTLSTFLSQVPRPPSISVFPVALVSSFLALLAQPRRLYLRTLFTFLSLVSRPPSISVFLDFSFFQQPVDCCHRSDPIFEFSYVINVAKENSPSIPPFFRDCRRWKTLTLWLN